MTIGELKQQIKDLLHVGSGHDVTDLVIVDRLTLQALNNARLWAERENDFALAMVRGTMVVSPSTGGALNAVTDIATGGLVTIKSLVTCFLESPAASGQLYPLTRRPMSTYAGMVQRSNMLREVHRVDDYARPDVVQDTEFANLEVLTLGGRVYLEPMPNSSTPTTLTVHGYRWMPKYTVDADNDFFTEYGSDFLMWKALIEVNHKLEVYVQRQEGTLPPPITHRDESWEALLKWDSFMHEEGREHTLGS